LYGGVWFSIKIIVEIVAVQAMKAKMGVFDGLASTSSTNYDIPNKPKYIYSSTAITAICLAAF
jgi:hypothetical protein